MTRRQALILKVSVIWTIWVWLVLIRNMITTPGLALAFRAVHISLAVISLVFAGITWGIVVSNRRKATQGSSFEAASNSKIGSKNIPTIEEPPVGTNTEVN